MAPLDDLWADAHGAATLAASGEADAVLRGRQIRAGLPPGGLFAGLDWRISPVPFALSPSLADDLESLGRVLHQFNRAANLLYRRSVEGKAPSWVAAWLDRGKPESLIAWQRHAAFRNALPRVLRPDLLLTDDGYAITELDAVPGGIGLTAWLNEAYASPANEGLEPLPASDPSCAHRSRTKPEAGVIGGARGMLDGFAAIFGSAPTVHILVSPEAATYRPEMEWMADRLGRTRFHVGGVDHVRLDPGDAVYRFFELFDLANVPCASALFDSAAQRQVLLTPPARPLFEEKMLLALLWNRNLRSFWHQELGAGYLARLRRHVPFTWVLDPTPLPPQAVLPELGLTDWQQLKTLSQRERNLILKMSGFSDRAWGARSVSLGSDMSQGDWSAAVDEALQNAARSPFVLQRYHAPRQVEAVWVDTDLGKLVPMAGRVRLCPYYFVHGDGDAARPRLGGVLATVCPAEKKIIHGMSDAILAPCSA